MNNKELETLQDIKQIMERSSRFISLSGWSGIAAGCCALAGAAIVYPIVTDRYADGGLYSAAETKFMLLVAAGTFIAALISALFFTYIRSKRLNIPVWGNSSKRLIWSIAVPLVAGGTLLLKMVCFGYFGLIAPGCLIIYGISLFTGSKQTLGEIKYLGYSEIALGCISLFFIGYGLIFWTIGFGILHIVYGILMWLKYEKKKNE